MSSFLIEAKEITKVYPDNTLALRNVNFQLKHSEIHGLLGENGAGKTTLTKIIYGILRPTSGEIFVEGEKVFFRRPHDALMKGIGMVQQHFALVGNFTALENILLGTGYNPRGRDAKKLRDKVEELCEKTGLRVPLDEKAENLALGARQRVEILKMLFRNVKVLILDEPTSSLTPVETSELFKTLVSLKQQGKSIIFITHKLREVMEVCDRITVLRKGTVSGVLDKNSSTPEILARLMVGRDVELLLRKREHQAGNEVLIVRDLHVLNNSGTEAVRGVSFSVRSGEIFGIAGVEGNGQTELAEAISGMRKVRSGSILLFGKEIANLTPGKVRGAGAALIPEDRTKTGLILEMNLGENIILGKHKQKEFTKGRLILSWARVKSFAQSLISKFGIVVPSVETAVRSLSGGNQQKVVVSRELSSEPSFILASQPTRGLDVASTEYMRNLLLEMRERGKAVLLISADLDEVLQLSDRVAIMYEGRIMDIVMPEKTTRERIGLLMGGIKA